MDEGNEGVALGEGLGVGREDARTRCCEKGARARNCAREDGSRGWERRARAKVWARARGVGEEVLFVAGSLTNAYP